MQRKKIRNSVVAVTRRVKATPPKTNKKIALERREKFIAKAKTEFNRQEQLHLLFKEKLRPLTEPEKIEVRKYVDYLEKIFMNGLGKNADKREMEIRWMRNHPKP